MISYMMMASIINDGIFNRDRTHIQHTGLIMIGIALIGVIGVLAIPYSQVLLLRTSEGSLITRLTNRCHANAEYPYFS